MSEKRIVEQGNKLGREGHRNGGVGVQGGRGFREGKIRGGVEAVDIVHLMENYGLSEIDVLKIDIEGSEYEVFDETCEAWIDKVRMVIIELHDWIQERGIEKRVLDVMERHKFTYEIIGENYVFIKSEKGKKK